VTVPLAAASSPETKTLLGGTTLGSVITSIAAVFIVFTTVARGSAVWSFSPRLELGYPARCRGGGDPRARVYSKAPLLLPEAR